MLTLDEPVTTERLVLRAFRQDDLDDVHAMQSDAELVRYIPWPLRSREESAAWIDERVAQDRLAAEGDFVSWAVERRADGAVIGAYNAWWRSALHEHAEVGFVLARPAQGQGYGTEALRAVVDALFDRLPLHRVSGRADARNRASATLMARVGMRQEAHFREDELFKGEWTDTVVYAVLRDEWRERRGR